MQNVPKFVVKRLHETVPPADSHPDADLLTAFAEQSLADRERALVMEHLARCGDCRDVVALALPAMESVARLQAASPARIGWLSWPVLRWAALAAGILAVTSIGVLQYNRRAQQKEVASNLVAKDPTSTAGSAQVAPPVNEPAPPKAAASGADVQKESIALQKPAAGSGVLTVPAPNRAKISGGVGGGTGAGIGNGSGGGQAVLDQRASLSQQAAASPAPMPVAPRPEMRQQVAVGGASESVEVEAAAGPVKTESASEGAQNQLAQNQSSPPLQGRSVTNLDVVKAKDAVPGQAAGTAPAPALAPPTMPLQTSPALMARASPRWTVSSAGVLQRSFDAGKTWENVNPALNPAFVAGRAAAESVVTADQSGADKNADKKLQKAAVPTNFGSVFHAVAALGLDVWAGGSAGVLYHTADGGNRWIRVVPSSAGTALTGDIASIQFLDPQHGRIATSSGELWITSDAGQSWQRQLRP